MLFQPNLVSKCPKGLDLFPAVVVVPGGSSKIVKIPVQNPTKHDLPKRTVLGTLEETTEIKPINCFPGGLEPMSPNTVNTSSAQTFHDHVDDLRRVLCPMREHGIKLRPKKCELFKNQVRYLGCLVTHGVQINPKDIQ